MAELEGLQFSVVSENTDKTAASLDRLTASLSGMKSALKGVSTSGLTRGLKAINEALSNTDNDTINKLKQLGEAGNALQRLSGVRISASIAKQISAIADATAKLTGDSITKVDDLAKALTQLNDIKAPKITVKTPKATDELKKVTGDASQSNADKTGGGNERNTEQKRVPKDSASVDTKYWTNFSRKVDVATNTLNRFLDAGMKARSAFINLGKGALNAAADIGDKLTAGFRNAASTASQFLHSIGRIALYRAIRSAIKQVTEGLKEGVDNMYQWSLLADNTFAKSMDTLATSSQYLKNSFAAMVAPLLNAVAPAIDFIIDKVVSLFNVINQVFATLTGKSSWTKALKAPVKYATAATDAANDNAKANKKAAKAAKDYQLQLLGFDELNVLDSNKNKDSSSPSGGSKTPSGSGGGADYGVMFTEEPISKKIKDWLAKDDWTDLGKMVADKANALLAKVDDWFKNTLEPFLNSWALKIGTFINGFVEEFNWELLGQTIADGLNAVIRPLNTFLTTVNWEAIGNGFARAVDSIFTHVDWPAVGQLVGNGLNVVIDTLHGFLTGFSENAYTYGLDFATAVNNIFSTVHWNKIADDIVLGVASIRDILNGLNDGIEWDQIKQDIDTGLNNAIRNVDAAGLGKAASDLIKNVLDVFGSIDWYSVGNKIGQFIANIDWSGILSDVIDGIFRFAAGYVSGSFSGDGVLFNSIVFGIPLLKGAIDIGSDALKDHAIKKSLSMSDPIGDAIENGIKGLNPSIVGGIAGIGVGLPMYILGLKDAVTNGLDLLNGAVIPAGSTMAGAGVGAIIGSLGGPIGTGVGALIGLAVGLVTDGVVYITQHASEIKAKLSDIWNAVKDKASEIWGNISTTVSGIWDDLKTKAGDVFSSIKDKVGDAWDKIKSKTSDVWNSVKTTVTDKWNNLKDAASTTFGDIKDKISTKWDDVKTKTGNVWDTLKSSLSSKWDGIKGNADTKFGSIKDTVSGKWDDLNGKTTSIWSSIVSKISGSWSGIVSNTGRSLSSMLSNNTSGWSSILSSTSGSMSGLLNVISSGNRGSLNNVISFVRDMMAKATEGGRGYVDNMRSGLYGLANTIQSIMNSAMNPVRTVVNSMRSWGYDMMNNFADGIRSAGRWVTSSVSNIASSIRSLIHFSHPDIGPLADFNAWPIDMMRQFAEGIENNSYLVTRAMESLTTDMSVTMKPAVDGSAFTQSGVSAYSAQMQGEESEFALRNALFGAIVDAMNTQDDGSGNLNVNVYLDGEVVYRNFVKRNNDHVKQTGESELSV